MKGVFSWLKAFNHDKSVAGDASMPKGLYQVGDRDNPNVNKDNAVKLVLNGTNDKVRRVTGDVLNASHPGTQRTARNLIWWAGTPVIDGPVAVPS